MPSKNPEPATNHAVACVASCDQIFASLSGRLRFADFLSLRLVCRPWRRFCRRLGHPPPPFPWLMLPPAAAATAPTRHFYDIPNGRSYAYAVPGHHCLASRAGWLVLARPGGAERPRHLFLVNPVTGAQVHVPWPFDGSNDHHGRFHAVLTSSPADEDCFLVAAADRHVAYCSPGRGSWLKLRAVGYRHDAAASDVVSVGATVYLVDGRRKLWRVDLRSPEPAVEHVDTELVLPGRRRHYLVESLGEVHLVVSDADTQDKCFALFRLDWQGKRWVEAAGLGGRVLLLGRGCSASVPAAAACRAACVNGGNGTTILIAHQPSCFPEVNGATGAPEWFWTESTLGGETGRPAMKKTVLHRPGEFVAHGDSFWFFPSIDPDSSQEQLRVTVTGT